MQTGKKKNVGVRRTPQYLNKPIQLFPRSTVYWALLYILWGPQTDTISPSPCPKAAHKAFGSDQLIRPLEPKTGFFQELGLAGHWNWVDRTSAGFQDTEQCRKMDLGCGGRDGRRCLWIQSCLGMRWGREGWWSEEEEESWSKWSRSGWWRCLDFLLLGQGKPLK